MELTLDQFAKATGATDENAARYFVHAVAAMERFSIDNPTRIAAFCATISVETARLTAMEENLHYRDAERLAGLFKRVFDQDHNGVISPAEVEAAKPYLRNAAALSMKLYGGFHGRGGGMLTWEGNYRKHSEKLGYDYVRNPGLLLDPFHAMLSAASFWDEAKCNDVAHDMGEVTLRWNGPKRLHLAERIAQRDVAASILA